MSNLKVPTFPFLVLYARMVPTPYASGLTTLRKVTFPLSLPGVVAGTLLTSLFSSGAESYKLMIIATGERSQFPNVGPTERKLRHQVQEGLEKVAKDRLSDVVIAYEPIWAIGTGKVATPADVAEMHAAIRTALTDRYGDLGGRIRILYGGSVKAENAAELFACRDVDGALVGGASLTAKQFVPIVEAAARS